MAQNDSYGYHEVVHLSSIIAGLWEDDILKHGATQENEELKNEATEILEKITNFYQRISEASNKKFSGRLDPSGDQ